MTVVVLLTFGSPFFTHLFTVSKRDQERKECLNVRAIVMMALNFSNDCNGFAVHVSETEFHNTCIS